MCVATCSARYAVGERRTCTYTRNLVVRFLHAHRHACAPQICWLCAVRWRPAVCDAACYRFGKVTSAVVDAVMPINFRGSTCRRRCCPYCSSTAAVNTPPRGETDPSFEVDRPNVSSGLSCLYLDVTLQCIVNVLVVNPHCSAAISSLLGY